MAPSHVKIINRCFMYDTLEEIYEHLEKERGHPFVDEVLERMNKNSPLSMKLGLEMVRRAFRMDYKAVLEMEYRVAYNKIMDSDFDIGMKEVLGIGTGKPAPHNGNW